MTTKRHGAATAPRSCTETTRPRSASDASPDHEFAITRIFDTPRDHVFKAWTDPMRVARWWGPGGYTHPICELDARPGGAIRVRMLAPDGAVHEKKGVFHDVAEPERLVFTMVLEDQQGETRLEALMTVIFAGRDGKTALTVHVSVVTMTAEAANYMGGMEAAWRRGLDRLDAHMTTN